MNALLTWVFALGIGYISYEPIQLYVSKSWQGIAIAALVLTGEKIVTYLIYKAKVEEFLSWLLQAGFDKLKQLFK